MKALLLGTLLCAISASSFALPEHHENMRHYLKEGKRISFRFDDMTVQTLVFLLESEKKIKVVLDQNVDTKQEIPVNIRDLHFLAFLEISLKKLGLKYEVLDPKTIRIYR